MTGQGRPAFRAIRVREPRACSRTSAGEDLDGILGGPRDAAQFQGVAEFVEVPELGEARDGDEEAAVGALDQAVRQQPRERSMGALARNPVFPHAYDHAYESVSISDAAWAAGTVRQS
ncbi:hypothetical protein [Streptomyces lincolnensis]|uniref:hypothetical protein n=1 Tax=Streptomyces lincolnensis TaxID=1915 RepID=UPI0037D45FF7